MHTRTRAKNEKNETPASQPAAPLAQQGQTEIAPRTSAEDAFKEYAETRDVFLSTPFAHNTSLARAGAPFDVLAIADRIVQPNEINQRTEPFEAVVMLAELRDDYQHVVPNTQETQVFKAGTRVLISLEKNDVRINDQRKLRELVEEYGAVPNLALQEYPSTKAMRANPIGIVHHDSWKTVNDLAKQRGLIKG